MSFALLPAIGAQVPRSHSITVPPPYCPCGIVPSKVAYESGWSSVRTASRFSSGSRLGPRVTAQLFRTPSTSSRKSQCSRVASCFWTMKLLPFPGASVPAGSAVFAKSRLAL